MGSHFFPLKHQQSCHILLNNNITRTQPHHLTSQQQNTTSPSCTTSALSNTHEILNQLSLTWELNDIRTNLLPQQTKKSKILKEHKEFTSYAGPETSQMVSGFITATITTHKDTKIMWQQDNGEHLTWLQPETDTSKVATVSYLLLTFSLTNSHIVNREENKKKF